MKKTCIILLTMLLCVVSVQAQSFEVDGISYNVTKEATDGSPGEVEVTGGEIKEVIEFPETVTYDAVTYTVTSIGNNAFSGRYDSNNFTRKYVIPGTVTTIGNSAFYDNYYLEEVEFNEGLQTIGSAAFGYNFALKEIRLPSTLLSIDNDAFITNQNSDISVYCTAATPPNIHSTAFQGRTNGPLHVTKFDVEAYKEADNWKEFSEIIGDIEFTDRCYSPVFTVDNNLLTMSCKTEGAAIYYTTDGSTPDENALRYTSPISYTTSLIIRAIAIAEGYENSAVREFSNKEYIESITNVTDEQGVHYTLGRADDGSFYYSVTGHSDELSTEIVIPEYLNGCLVKTIESNVFYACSALTSITIPNSVTTIGNQAFVACANLTSVIFGDQLTTIGYEAFHGCSSLLSITIPSSVMYVGYNAFAYCYRLNEVKVVVMDYSEFCNNNIFKAFDAPVHLIDKYGNEIIKYTIPEGITTIGENAFKNCVGLTSVAIPNSVTTIGDWAFQGCSGLELIISELSTPFAVNAFDRFDATLVVPKGSRADYKSVGGWEFAFTFEEGETIPDGELTDEQGLIYTLNAADNGSFFYSVTGHSDELDAEIVIPADLGGCPVMSIEDNVFKDCTDLSSITIPNSVTAIGAWAFEGCTSLSSIRIPNSVISIGERAFQNCNSLTTVTLGNQLTTIGGYAFTKCENLSSIIIPNSVSDLGEFAFAHCSGLTSVKISNGITSLKAGTFYGCSGLSTIQIPNSIKSIEDGVDAYQDGYGTGWGCGPYCYGVFAYCSNLTSVKIGENVISLGAGAFSWCSSLTSITLPDKLENIGAKAFSACFSLTSVNFGTGITSIGNDAFRNCAFTSFTVPNSVTTIGEGAFSSNYKLTTIALGDGISEIKNGTFSSCTALSSIIIPDGVTSIGSEAFQWCQTLTSIKLSSSLTSLGERVFSDCPQLKSIELPNSFTVIPEGLFSGNNFQYIKLGNNVKSIGKNSFGSSELILEIGTATPPTIDKDAFPNIEYLSDINVIVPNAKAETAYKKKAVWEDMTFSNQSNISEVTVETPGDLSFELITQCNMMPAKVVDLKVNGTINADDFSQMLVNMKSLLRLDLSDCDITEIPAGALKDKTQLQALILPTSLQTIGQGAFQNCLYLQELTMQNGLQTIGQSAFQGCGYLTGELDLPSTVTTIGESAFVGTAYTSVKMPSALKTIGDNAFNNLPIAQRLVLPNRMQSVGVRAFAGTKITGLVIPDGLTTIGEEAFADTPIEGHVTIPDGVTSLGARVFRNTQISTVFLPNSIETVSEGLFQGCQNLDLVYVPDNYTGLASSVFDGCGNLTVLRLSANLAAMGEYSLQNTPLEYVKVPSQVETLSRGVLKNCTKLESLTLPASMTSVEAEALYGCTNLRNLSVEATTPPVIRDRSAIRGINTDKCLISIPTSAYRNYVLAEYWGQFVQMRNDIAVVTAGNGEIAFESVAEEEEEEEEEASGARAFAPRRAAARASRRAPQLASEEDSKTYVSNGSSVYAPQQGKVRFIITPAPGEEIVSATLDGEDIMPDIVDGVYIATADKKNAKLVVKFTGESQGTVVMAGDVNGDGNVTAQDASLVLQLVAKKITQDTEGVVYKAADVNGDGNVTAQDASLILQHVAKKINL